jgi:hypothetical protein
MKRSVLLVALPVIAAESAANASVTVTRGNSAPAYATLVTFDEVGGPVGVNPPNDAWAPQGISFLGSGEGNRFVGNNSTISGTTDNSFYGAFGVFINFSSDITAASLQYWDTSGSGGPFGGGTAVVALNDGVEVGFLSGPGVVGTQTNTWFNIVATDGMAFDEIRCVGFGFFPEAVVDNVSFVPAPGSLALLGLGGAAALRRRRR